MNENSIRLAIREELPHARDWFVDELIRFEIWFWKFFPDLKDRHYASAFEMEWLWTKCKGNPHDVVHRPKALSDLKKLEKSLRFICEMDFDYYLPLVYYQNTLKIQEVESNALKGAIFDFIGELNLQVNDATDGLFHGNLQGIFLFSAIPERN